MSIATGLITGVLNSATGLIRDYFPPDLPPEKKAELEQRMQSLKVDAQMAEREADERAQRLVTERIKALEGTASDLKSIWLLGPLMLFMRGLQRPAWGYATMYLDYMWFTRWHSLTDTQESGLMLINFLVLGFLFGERAVKNAAPFIANMIGKARGGK